VPRFPWDIPTIRVFMSMGCGALVISEQVGDTAPFEAGKNFVQASVSELPDTITYYLEHEDERRAITQSAHELITRELTLKKAVSEVLTLIIHECHS